MIDFIIYQSQGPSEFFAFAWILAGVEKPIAISGDL